MKGIARGIAAVWLVTGASTFAQAPTMKLGEVLVFTPSQEKPAADANSHVLQADRGGRKGQYLRVATRDLKAKPAGQSGSGASEYRLLSPVQVGSLPDIDVLGIHYIKVRPDRYIKVRPDRRDAFERFVGEKVHPAVGNLRPDLRLLYYKAVSGPEAGNYITIFALSRASRDKYWPGGSDSDVLRAAFEPVRPLTKELNTYFVEGSANTNETLAAAVYESREWSDFVLLRR